MNKILYILLFFSLHSYSQFSLLNTAQEHRTFIHLNKPSTKNELSLSLEKYITPQELTLISDYTTPPNLHNSIRAQFEVTKDGRSWNFRIYTGNQDLNKKIEVFLKSFLIKKIPNLKDLYQARNYIQLFSKEESKTIINASTSIVSDYPPMFKNCVENEFSDAYGCFKKDLENFIINSINPDVLTQEQIIGELRAPISFKIDKKGKMIDLKVHSYLPNTIRQGKIIDLKTVSYSKKVEDEITRVVKLYESQIIKSAIRNGIPFKSQAGKTIQLFINEHLTEEKISKLKENPFTTVFDEELRLKEINASKFNSTIPITKLFFNYNLKGELHDIWTNTYSKKLNNRIISIFKKKFIDTLNITKSYDRIYSLPIIRKIDEIQQVLCDGELTWLSSGVFKPCEDCKSFEEFQKQNITEIEKYILREFNATNTSYRLQRKEYDPKNQELAVFNIPNEEATLNRVLIDNQSKKRNNIHSELNNTEEEFLKKTDALKNQKFYDFYIPNDNEKATLNSTKIDNQSKKRNDLHLKLVVTEEGNILKKSGPHVRDFYAKKYEQFISNQSFMLLKDQIDTIIKKMPKFIKLPTKNGTPTGTELRSLSFYLVERLKF